MAQQYTRMVWPESALWGGTVTVNNHVYTKSAAPFDALNADVSGLQSAAAVTVALSGAASAVVASGGYPADPNQSQMGAGGARRALLRGLLFMLGRNEVDRRCAPFSNRCNH
jgi:hypothetical protein